MASLAALIMNLYMCKDGMLLYFLKNYQLLILISITQITSTLKSQYLSKLPLPQKWHMSGCPKFNLKYLLYTRGFSDIDCKLNIDGSINCCVYLICMHNIVYYQSKYGMPDCLNYES